MEERKCKEVKFEWVLYECTGNQSEVTGIDGVFRNRIVTLPDTTQQIVPGVAY